MANNPEFTPYIEKNPHDPLRASDWNDMQCKVKEDIAGTKKTVEDGLSKQLKSHKHSGDEDGAKLDGTAINDNAIEGKHIKQDTDVTLKNLTTTGTLTASDLVTANKGLTVSGGELTVAGKTFSSLLQELNDLKKRLEFLELFKTFTNSIGMEFVLIPAGTFMMGSKYGSANEKPAHSVTITKPFYLGKYPVTQAQWKKLMGNNPSRSKVDDTHPVEYVSWNEVQTFINTLKQQEKEKPYRLPTEAEWEYACRAGTQTKYHFGDSQEKLKDYAWYSDNSNRNTHPVGNKKPNDWGLYDMHGQVWEWCQDWYQHKYPDKSVIDPQGPDSGTDRVLRGGSWISDGEWDCCSASRDVSDPADRDVNHGFRLSLGL